ncbi:hypothetical protein K7432_001906 [Basidiobolus ranarum]|uniref:Uncharacterized protein n=1 Tax=Basidiobolus ranarum TaxID=34480 RepID=A0ABR2W8S2_9FUNG
MNLRRAALLQLALIVLGVILISTLIIQEPSSTAACLGSECLHNTQKSYQYTIVTAASSNHFCPLLGFLYSISDTLRLLPSDEQPRIVVYDLGLSPEERFKLNNITENGYATEVVSFDYSKYPSFWNIKAKRGEYAWKTGIINEVGEKHPGVVLWMDSGDRATPSFLRSVVAHITKNGYYSPTSTGFMGEFTHPGMYKYFKAPESRYSHIKNCNGAFIGYDSRNETIMSTLIRPFLDCAKVKKCIAPPGSSRINHRQDQSVFTYLVISRGWRCRNEEGLEGLSIHQDDDCKAQIVIHERI